MGVTSLLVPTPESEVRECKLEGVLALERGWGARVCGSSGSEAEDTLVMLEEEQLLLRQITGT